MPICLANSPGGLSCFWFRFNFNSVHRRSVPFSRSVIATIHTRMHPFLLKRAQPLQSTASRIYVRMKEKRIKKKRWKRKRKTGNSLSSPVTLVQLSARRKVMPALEDTRGSGKKTVKCNMRAQYECWLLKSAGSVFLPAYDRHKAVRRAHALNDRRLSLV